MMIIIIIISYSYIVKVIIRVIIISVIIYSIYYIYNRVQLYILVCVFLLLNALMKI